MMPDEQTMGPREILARWYWENVKLFQSVPWESELVHESYREEAFTSADTQLAALETAGYVVVKMDRFERLQQRARMSPRNPEIADGILQAGDLDSLPVQDGSAT
jgi:hypothetical protein